jgi:hypothetical protein
MTKAYLVSPEEIATAVILGVCELPDYNSPDDQPDLLTCTVQQLRNCVINAFESWEPSRDLAREHMNVLHQDAIEVKGKALEERSEPPSSTEERVR